jgi:transposase InsO family protein
VRSSKRSNVIPTGAVHESPNRSPWRSKSKSTKTWFEGFSPITTGRDRAPGGPSWLTFLGHMKDSLWSMDLFRCESAKLRSHWVLVVMNQFARRIIGFGVHAGTVDGVALCRMFNRAIRGRRWMPNYLSSDNDPLYRFHQWQANLRILEVTG